MKSYNRNFMHFDNNSFKYLKGFIETEKSSIIYEYLLCRNG